MFKRLSFLLAAASLAFALPAVQAQTVDAAKSSVSASFKQMNVPGEGKFKQFTAQISYDPTKVAQAKANIDIDVSSFDIGSDEYNDEVKGKQWFNAKAFPKASFVSSTIKPVDAGHFEATGKLTIKGKTVDMTIPVSVKTDATGFVFDGFLPIKRLQFGIGDGEWKDVSVVADEVQVKFHLVAKK